MNTPPVPPADAPPARVRQPRPGKGRFMGQAGWPRLVAYAAAIVACLAVFALYTKPAIMVTLADQIWACFN